MPNMTEGTYHCNCSTQIPYLPYLDDHCSVGKLKSLVYCTPMKKTKQIKEIVMLIHGLKYMSPDRSLIKISGMFHNVFHLEVTKKIYALKLLRSRESVWYLRCSVVKCESVGRWTEGWIRQMQVTRFLYCFRNNKTFACGVCIMNRPQLNEVLCLNYITVVVSNFLC